MSHQSVTVIGNPGREFHSAPLQLRDRFLNVVAIERNVVRARRGALDRIGRVTTHFGLGQVENQPSLTHIREGKAQLVPDECPQLLGSRGIEHRMNAFDHIIH